MVIKGDTRSLDNGTYQAKLKLSTQESYIGGVYTTRMNIKIYIYIYIHILRRYTVTIMGYIGVK